MLTLREKEVLSFLQTYIANYEQAPTAAEIAEHLKIQSRGVVHRYLKALEDKGHIRLMKGRWRNIELITNTENKGQIPILGAIAAGSPIEAVQSPEVCDIQGFFSGTGRYALRIKGDSMIDEGIFDGDIVICQHAKSALSGQIVVALVDGENATLKRIHWESDGMVSLIPANQNHSVQRYQAARVEIQGVFIGLLRLPQ